MRILQPQSAMLTNLEALYFLRSVDAANNARDAQRAAHNEPPLYDGADKDLPLRGLRIVVRDSIQLLEAIPGQPDSDDETVMNAPSHPDPEEVIPKLLTALQPYKLTQPEKLMVVNCRPQNEIVLEATIEEVKSRFGEEELKDMVRIVREAFGDDNGDNGGDNDGGGDDPGEEPTVAGAVAKAKDRAGAANGGRNGEDDASTAAGQPDDENDDRSARVNRASGGGRSDSGESSASEEVENIGHEEEDDEEEELVDEDRGFGDEDEDD